MTAPTDDPPPSPDGELLLQCLAAPVGERTAVLTQLCDVHPDRADNLRALHAALDEFGLVDEPVPPLPTGTRFGPYRLLGQLGLGGMGAVHLAVHEPLGRQVALKVLHAGLAAPHQARDRFRREMAAMARLDHRNLCQVHDAGEIDGVPFLALRHVEGETLQQRFARERSAGDDDPAAERARNATYIAIVEKLARAMHTAHEAGLVHRDVKPANVMIEAGNGEPVLLDFGLAALDGDGISKLTLTGDRLGTPAYMAPEQITGARVDRRTDVHALGAILYEALSRRPVYDAPTREALYRRILAGEPTHARHHNAFVGRDLDVVLATALASDPDRRYATAEAFADDLQRIREGRPVLARREGPASRLVRFARRNPLVSTFVVSLVLAVVGAAVLLEIAVSNLRRAEAVERALSSRELAATSPRAALERADAAVEAEPILDTISALHGAAIGFHDRAVLTGHGGSLFGACWSPDGSRILTWSADGTARLCRSDGSLLATVRADNDTSWAEFAADGRFAVAADDGKVRVCGADGVVDCVLDHGNGDRAGDSPALPFFDPTRSHAVRMCRFSPDGSRLATTSCDRIVRVWDLATRKVIAALQHDGPAFLVAWSPDGNSLASAEGLADYLPDRDDFWLRIWRLQDDGRHAAIAQFAAPGSLRSIAWSPDGTKVLAACNDGTARLWAVPPGGECRVMPHHDRVLQALFAPDGKSILTSQANGEVCTWAATGEPVREPLHRARHEGPVSAIAFVAGGQRILTGSHDNTVRLFDAELRPLLVLRGHHERVVGVAASPDGRHVLSASWDRTARVWNLLDDRIPRLVGHRGRVRALARCPDGAVASCGDDRTLRFWDLATGQARELPIAAPAATIDFAPGANAGTVLLGHDDAIARTYATTTGIELARFPASQGRHASARFLGDRVLLTGFGVQRHSFAQDGSDRRTWGGPCWIGYALAISSGGLVATGDWNGVLTLFDANGGERDRVPASAQWIQAVAFSPAGDRLAAGGNDRTVRVWPLVARRLVTSDGPRTLAGLGGAVHCLAWSPNGHWLAAGLGDGSVHLFAREGREPTAVLRGHGNGAVNAVLFVDDDRLLSAGDDGAIQCWFTSTAALRAWVQERLRR